MGRPKTTRDGPSLICVGHVPDKTGPEDRMPPSLSLILTCRATLENDRTDCPNANAASNLPRIYCTTPSRMSQFHWGNPFIPLGHALADISNPCVLGNGKLS